MGKGTTYFFLIGNNGLAMSLCFIALAKDLFFYSWAEIVPRDEFVLTQ